MTSSWQFSITDDELTVHHPLLDDEKREAVGDFLRSDVGEYRTAVQGYLTEWRRVLAGEVEEAQGNGSVQSLDSGRVRLEALYEQWETMYFTIAEFDELLADYDAFLRRSSAPDR